MSIEDVIKRFVREHDVKDKNLFSEEIQRGNQSNQTVFGLVTAVGPVGVGGNHGNQSNQRFNTSKSVFSKKAANEPYDLIHWRDLTPTELHTLWKRVTQGKPVYVYSETLGEPVYWVRDETLAKQLLAKQSAAKVAKQEPLVCYTVAELTQLEGQPAEFLIDIHALKKRFDAQLKRVEPKPQQGGH